MGRIALLQERQQKEAEREQGARQELGCRSSDFLGICPFLCHISSLCWHLWIPKESCYAGVRQVFMERFQELSSIWVRA